MLRGEFTSARGSSQIQLDGPTLQVPTFAGDVPAAHSYPAVIPATQEYPEGVALPETQSWAKIVPLVPLWQAATKLPVMQPGAVTAAPGMQAGS
jgi:hypothetical protein